MNGKCGVNVNGQFIDFMEVSFFFVFIVVCLGGQQNVERHLWHLEHHHIVMKDRDSGVIVRGGKDTSGCRGQFPLAGVQGAEPLGGDHGSKPPEADVFLVLKS